MADIPESTKSVTVTQADVTDADRAAVTAFHNIQIKRIMAGDKTLGDNRDVIEQAFARHRIEAEQRAKSAALPNPIKLAERFCATPLPESVCADLCATQPGAGRYGTNLMTVAEATLVFRAALSTSTRASPPAMDREAVGITQREVDALRYLLNWDGTGKRVSSVMKTFTLSGDERSYTKDALESLWAKLSTLSADAIRQGEGDIERAAKVADHYAEEAETHADVTDLGARVEMNWHVRAEALRSVANRIRALATPASHASDGGGA